MKQILTLALFTFLSFQMSAQCTPDQMFADSTGFVFPPPYTEDRPEGGIPDPACIDEFYEFVLTLKIPETITYQGIEANLEYLDVATTGAVSNLPTGMSYACNPPTCHFTPDLGLACIVINGTATDVADIGMRDLTINATVKVDILAVPFNTTFPDNTGLIDGADGQYTLVIQENGTCATTSINDLAANAIQVRNVPNPFAEKTTIQIDSKVNDTFDWIVYDVLGNMVHHSTTPITVGENRIEFDGSQLDNGMYLYTISKGNTQFTGKMVIQK